MSSLFERRGSMRRRFIGRVSVEEQTEKVGYQNYVMIMIDGLVPVVFLDGEPQPFCVTADSEEGWIKRPVLDNRKLVCVGDLVKEEIVKGTVEIRLEPKR